MRNLSKLPKTTTILLFIIILFNSQINNNFNLFLATNNNKLSHTNNGNISKLGSLKILHFNKGNSKFENKIDDILYVIGKHKPDIFSIQEANYDITNHCNIPGYNIEYNTLTKNHNVARTIIIIKEGINYKRCNIYEIEYISSIWLQIF